MARFSRTFLQGMLNPAMQQPLFDAAKSIGQTPGLMTMMRQEKEKKEKRDKGLLSGTFDIQQAAQQGNLTPERLKSYSEDMRNLDVPVQNILTNITNLQRLDLESKERLRNERQSTAAKTFIDSLGEEYASLYAASGDFDSVYTQYLDNTRQSNIATLAQQLDPSISDDLASNMTSSDLVNLYESKKEDKGAQKWAKWQGTNPEINDSNRQQAIEAAVAAHGKNAPKIVADLEAQQIKNKAEREGDKSVSVLITMKSNSAFSGIDALGAGKKQIITKSLPVDAQGKLSVDAKNWLEAHAQTAMVQDTGETWPAGGAKNTSTTVNVGGGGGSQTNKTTSSVTLGNLAPDLITNLSNLELK